MSPGKTLSHRLLSVTSGELQGPAQALATVGLIIYTPLAPQGLRLNYLPSTCPSTLYINRHHGLVQ